jgi:23S rRNA pseudouridine2604 synthase
MKSIYTSAKFFLVQSLGISNKEAVALILEKKMFVNGQTATLHQEIFADDEVIIKETVLQLPQTFHYYAYYKPRGVECTLNTDIPQNLVDTLKIDTKVFPVGRLDKESEGLLILTNDGRIYNKIINSASLQEKEYIVEVDQAITPEFITQMSEGIVIMGQKTRPAKAWMISEHSFGIILTQGLNRQIRRMCYKLGYEVIKLKRVRIINLDLGNLQPGTLRVISKNDIDI